MRTLFNPAIALMNRLWYPQKFILISLLFVLPLALVNLLLIPSLNERIDFAQQEKYGTIYLRPLRRLSEHSLQNKVLAHNYLNGDSSLKAKLLDNQARIDEDIKTLENINRELEDVLKTAEPFKELQTQWQEVKQKMLNLELSASDELQSGFIATVQVLISLVGNTSNLILDPDLDSYYLIDTTLLKLPESQSLLAQAWFLGEQAIAHRRLTAEERDHLNDLAGLIQSNLEATQNSLGVAVRNNPAQNLETNLTGPLLEFSIASEAFLETLRRELITPPTINPQSAGATYPILASQALTANFKLWDQAVIELDRLLQARIESFTQRKYVVIIVTALGLGLVTYLWIGFYLVVMQTVSSLDDAAKRMVNGNMSQPVHLDNQDELGQVVLSFNEIASALVKARAELEQKVEERTTELSRTNERLTAEIAERQQAEKALHRYAGRLEVLYEIDRAILAAHSPQEIAQTALRHLRRLVPCRRAGLALLDYETNEVVFLNVEVNHETQVKAGTRLPMEGFQHIIDELQQGRVFVHADLHLFPTGEMLFAEGIQAGISLPLITNEALIGAVSLWANNSGAFSEEEVNIAREVTAQLAIALQQARLFEAEAQRRQEAEALRDTAAALNSTLNLDEVLDRILNNVGRVVQHKMINIALIKSGFTHVVRARGYAEQGRAEAVLKSRHSLAETPLLRRMVETGQPVVIPETQNHSDWVVKDEPWLRAYIGVPIRVQGEVIGFLNLDSDTPRVFTAADAERLQAFADQAAIAIQNARLYAETEQRAEHLAVLHELDRAITASLDADQVYQAFAEQTLRLLPYDFMSINLVEGDSLYVTYAAGEEPLRPVGSRVPLKALEMSRRVIEQDQPFLSTNLVSDQRFAAYQPTIRMGLRSAMILPLRVKGQVIGIWFLGRRQVEGYCPDDLTTAQSVADQLAIAVENARLFEQVQDYAAGLEQRVADRTRELSALYDVTAVASGPLDLPTTLERSLDEVVGAMRSQAGTIHLLDETGETLHLSACQGFSPDLAAQLEALSAEDSLPGWVIKHDDSLIVPDLTFEPRSVLRDRNGFQTYLGVPMRANGQTLGVLSVVRARGQPQFNIEEMALLTTIADQVGVVVESARLRQMAERAAVMEERARLARDLHDSVTQLLYSVNLFASVGREAYDLGDMAQVNSCLAELGQIAQQALKEMRLLVYELRPLALAQEGLVGALRQRLDSVERRSGVQVQLQAELMLDLPGPVEEALYQITLEALNNALKHAAATTITVSIGASDGRIELEVADNGLGFDSQAAIGKGGLGLTSMQERVEKLGGILTIMSVPGGGTKVRATLEV